MGLDIDYIEGQTPLDDDEKEGLLIHTVATRRELDEFEQLNIQKAIEWTLAKKFSPEKILSDDFVCRLHRKMFGDVWRWAGQFRRSDKNLGCDWQQIPVQLKQLNDDAAYWIKNNTFREEEIAIRYKHRIVSIHCFANGNGRHSRLMADVIMSHLFKTKVFGWGRQGLDNTGEARTTYLTAVKQADNGTIEPLIRFAIS